NLHLYTIALPRLWINPHTLLGETRRRGRGYQRPGNGRYVRTQLGRPNPIDININGWVLSGLPNLNITQVRNFLQFGNQLIGINFVLLLVLTNHPYFNGRG